MKLFSNLAASYLATRRVHPHGFSEIFIYCWLECKIFRPFWRILGQLSWRNNSTPGYLALKEWKPMPTKWQELHSGFIHNSQTLRKNQMSINRRVTQTVHNGVALGNKKGVTSWDRNDMDKSQTLPWVRETNHQKQTRTALISFIWTQKQSLEIGVEKWLALRKLNLKGMSVCHYSATNPLQSLLRVSYTLLKDEEKNKWVPEAFLLMRTQLLIEKIASFSCVYFP